MEVAMYEDGTWETELAALKTQAVGGWTNGVPCLMADAYGSPDICTW